MTFQITKDEYIEISGVPLSTPAWETLDLSELNDGPALRGSDYEIPQIRGLTPRLRNTQEKIVNIPMVFYGDKNADGDPKADFRTGLLENLNEFKMLVARPYRYLPGVNPPTRTLTWYRGHNDLEAQVHVSPRLNIEYLNAYTARAVLEIIIPSGAFQYTTTTTHTKSIGAGQTVITFDAPGSGEVYDAVITVNGDSDDLVITSNTTGYGLTYDDLINGPFVISCGTYEASDNLVDVSGKVFTTGTNLWLPILPGDNEWNVERTNGSASTMVIEFKGVEL